MDHRIEVPRTITIDGIEHEVASLGPQVAILLEIHADWRRDLADVRLEVAKHEAALRNLELEIADTAKKQLAAAAETVEKVEPAPKARKAKAKK